MHDDMSAENDNWRAAMQGQIAALTIRFDNSDRRFDALETMIANLSGKMDTHSNKPFPWQAVSVLLVIGTLALAPVTYLAVKNDRALTEMSSNRWTDTDDVQAMRVHQNEIGQNFRDLTDWQRIQDRHIRENHDYAAAISERVARLEGRQ